MNELMMYVGYGVAIALVGTYLVVATVTNVATLMLMWERQAQKKKEQRALANGIVLLQSMAGDEPHVHGPSDPSKMN